MELGREGERRLREECEMEGRREGSEVGGMANWNLGKNKERKMEGRRKGKMEEKYRGKEGSGEMGKRN